MDSLGYWMGELVNRSEATRFKYKVYFDRFCEWAGKTPDELLGQRKQDLKGEDVKEQRNVETLLKSFLASLKEEGNSVGTQQVAYAAVRSFFEMHYQPLRMRRGDYPSGESLGSRAATKEAIKAILSDSKKMKDSRKIRALIFFLKDTGLRVSDALKVNYGDIGENLEKGENFIPLSLVTQKNKTTAKTFIGPETVHAIKEYLDERRKGTRRIEPEVMGKDSPLFKVNENGEVKRMSRSGLSSILSFHCRRIGEHNLSAHSFRKYFQTQLEAAGVSPNWIDQMIGHRLINSRDSYSLPTDQQLREAYEKAYPQLRVYPDRSEVEGRVSNLEERIVERNGMIAEQQKEIMVLQSELEELRTERARVSSSADAIQKLLRRVEELEKKLGKA